MFSVHHNSIYCHEPLHIPKVVTVKLLSPAKRNHRRFKERHSLPLRKQESTDIMQRFRSKLPVIVEKADGEKNLPYLDRTKFIVPDDMSMTQFSAIVRTRLNLKSSQAFYLMVRNRCLTLTRTIADVYWEYKDLDGFLYMTYSAQEMYG